MPFTDYEFKIIEAFGSIALYILTLAAFVKYIMPKMLDSFTTALKEQRQDFIETLKNLELGMARLTKSVERQTKVIIFSSKSDKSRQEDALQSLIADKDDLTEHG